MIDRASELVERIIRNLGSPQGFSSAQFALQTFDLESVSEDKRRKLINAIRMASAMRGGPLLVLSLPPSIQAEMSLFCPVKVLGIDRMALKRATPNQIVRYLTADSTNKNAYDAIISSCNFSAFTKDHWLAYFSKCSTPIAAAKTFLSKSMELGGFSDGEITQLVLRNPALVEFIPVPRLEPNTVVALLISGRAESLWRTYDFTRFAKGHWQELFLHTNPSKLPDACRPFIENKDGKGFSNDELIAMARRCHALINLLDPNKVPFSVAYELYQTGRADLLWKNFPFASLDKCEWRTILGNPSVRIPDMFLEVAKSGRFKDDELCEMAIGNDRLLPFLIGMDIDADKVIDLLIAARCDYIWEHYHFSKFSAANWERLILGLKSDDVIRPRAMSSFSLCKGITEAQVSRILRKNPTYAPHVSLSLIAPDVAVEILVRGKGDFLWPVYDFTRLNDDQWLHLLECTFGEVPPVGRDFLQYRAASVDNVRLNNVLSQREELIAFVDAKLISPELAAKVLARHLRHELWNRFDFARFDRSQLKRVLKESRLKDEWPDSVRACLKAKGQPLDTEDLIEIASVNPVVVIALVSTDWLRTLDVGSFTKLIALAVQNYKGLAAIRERFGKVDDTWDSLPIGHLKHMLVEMPDLRSVVAWNNWPFAVIAEMAKTHPVYEKEIPRPVLYFIWKHFKSLFGMGALTAAAIVAICLQNRELARQESQRQHWNSIVQTVKQHDQARSYRALKKFWAAVEPDDQSVIKNDLFVKHAFENLMAWEEVCSIIESEMTFLRSAAKVGWDSVNEDTVEATIDKLEKCNVNSFEEASEFQSLKSAHAEYRKEKAERARIKSLRDKLVDINGRFRGCEDLGQLGEWKTSLSSLVHENELKDEATQTLEKLTQRIELIQAQINAKRIAQEVSAISNAVVAVFGELRKATALKNVSAWSAEYRRIGDMPGFDEYVKLPCYRDYVHLSDDFKKFEELMLGASDKLVKARRLDEKFTKEFMTIEGGAECSNIISYCEASLKISKSKGWHALSGANEMLKKLVENIFVRDLRCRALVDKINTATDYAGYLKAKKALTGEFGHFAQFKHLGALCNIEPSDLNQSYGHSIWGRLKGFKYHFVGVIRLHPEAPSKTIVYILPGKITSDADLYTLWKSSSGSVSSRKILTQHGLGKFYMVSGVNYSNSQGTPLFVRSEHYAGKED